MKIRPLYPPLPLVPTATASIHYRRTKTGSVLTVRLITRDAALFRCYDPLHAPDDAVRLALHSAGIAQAWCQCALPMEWEGRR